MSKYRFENVVRFEGRTYQPGQDYELSDTQARAMGFVVTEAPKAEPKQMEDYANKQMTSKKKGKE